MRKPLLIAFAIILSLTACTNRPVFWLPPEIFNPDPEPTEECKHINLTEVTEYFDQSSKHYPKTGICAECGEEITRESIEIGTAEDLATLGKDLSEYYNIGCYTISIIDDIDMTGKPWPFIELDGYSSDHYYGKNFVIDGFFDDCIALNKFSADFSLTRSSFIKSSVVRLYKSAKSLISPFERSFSTIDEPTPSISIASFDAQYSILPLICAGQFWKLGQ